MPACGGFQLPNYLSSDPMFFLWSEDHPGISYLQLSQGETTSSSYTAVVFDRWASNNWSQLVDRSWCDGCGLCKTSIATSQFSARLFIHRVREILRSFSCSFLFLCLLPGRSELGLVAANPFGNLPFNHQSASFAWNMEEENIRLWGICWLCLIAILSGCDQEVRWSEVVDGRGLRSD